MGGLTAVAQWNMITVILVLILAVSMYQGAKRGASGSARQLLELVTDGAATGVALYLAWRGMGLFSPLLESWLIGQGIEIPNRELIFWMQMYYTLVTSLRDFSLMRGALIFILLYGLLKGLLNQLVLPLLDHWGQTRAVGKPGRRKPSWLSTPAGAAIGGIIGGGRALLFIAGVLVFSSMFPDSSLGAYASGSSLYQKGANRVIAPFTGEMLDRLPVFSQSVEEEFNHILRRKYEVLDARIPDDIAAAAKEITDGKDGDEAKAKALYHWVGSRVKYDWEKVRLYEEDRIWKEQTPEMTFSSRSGVCIDYSRLYAVMARSVGLEVKVVTGLGSDGRGGMGSHAWNEVYLAEQSAWVPLDSTWVSSGGNWFNPDDFYDTHVKEA
ncbi:MAG: transglutaminase-like enzyme putative cysteine protease [Paenibacillaceae bacterium]|jgi:hypothetical protein|nr:transglutaminase-like enzyme putative cysteine protease [Paenibacillaceae bacterium]